MKIIIKKSGIILFALLMVFLQINIVAAAADNKVSLANQDKGYSITYAEVSLGVQPQDKLSVLANQKVYDIQVSLDGQPIEAKKLSKPIVLSIPVAVNNSTEIDINQLAVYHLDKNEWTLVKNTRWDKAGNKFVFRTTQLGQYTVFTSNQTFDDLTPVKGWAQYEVEIMTTKGVINGKKEGKFSPNDKVTRAEFVKMIIHTLDLLEEGIEANFDDVKSSDWFYREVAAAAKLGIVNGKNPTKFAPHDVITREEMATITVRALKLIQATQTGDIPTFEDQKQISPWALEAINIAVKNNLLKGINSNSFAPKENATRAQAAVLVYRLYKLVDEKLAENLLTASLENEIVVEPESNDTGTGTGSLPLTVEDISNKYQPQFNALEETARGQLDELIEQALNEYEDTKNNPDFDALSFIAKYIEKGESLQTSVDKQFYQLVSQMEGELKANNLPLDLVEDAKAQYKKMVDEMEQTLRNQYL